MRWGVKMDLQKEARINTVWAIVPAGSVVREEAHRILKVYHDVVSIILEEQVHRTGR